MRWVGSTWMETCSSCLAWFSAELLRIHWLVWQANYVFGEDRHMPLTHMLLWYIPSSAYHFSPQCNDPCDYLLNLELNASYINLARKGDYHIWGSKFLIKDDIALWVGLHLFWESRFCNWILNYSNKWISRFCLNDIPSFKNYWSGFNVWK